MSHGIVKRLKIANGQIIINSASNNVRPLYYYDCMLDVTESNIRMLFIELCGLCLQPMASCKWWYELMQRPFMRRQGWYLDHPNKPEYWVDSREGVWDKTQQEQDYREFREVIRDKFKV